MSQQTTAPAQTLQLRRTYQATPERLFAAWSNPEFLNAWFHPNSTMTTKSEVDLREGGRYRIEMYPPGQTADPYVVLGRYQTIQKPDKLAFTWQWSHEDETMRSLVTVEFKPVDNTTTELILTHSQLANEEEKTNHTEGWVGTFDRLQEWLTTN